MGSNPITLVWQDCHLCFSSCEIAEKNSFPTLAESWLKSHRTARCGCSGVYPTMPELAYFFSYWTNVVPLQFSHPYDTQVLAYHLKSLYRGVCKLCRVPIMVLEQIANLSVVSSACRFKSYTLRYVNTCAETNVGNGRTETSCWHYTFTLDKHR